MVFRANPFDGKQTVDTGISFFRPISAPTAASRSAGAVGDALAGLGETIPKVVNAFAVRAEEDRQRTSKWEAEKSMMGFLEGQRERLREEADNITESGAGFYVKYHNQLKEEASKWVDILPEDLRPEYEVRMVGQYDTLLNQAAGIEQGQRKSFLNGIVMQKMDSLKSSVVTGLVDVDRAAQDADAFVTGLGIPENAGNTLRKVLGRTIEASHLERLSVENPQLVYETLKPFGVGVAAKGTTAVQGMIIDQAQAAGLDPRTMLAIAAQESGFKADAASKSSTAKGLWQFTLALQKQLGIQDVNDPQLQTVAAMRYFQDMRDRLGANGIPEKPDTVYAAHFLGIGGAVAVYRADDSASFYDVYASVAGTKIARLALEGNAGMFPKGAATTVGDVKAKIASTMTARLAEIEPMVANAPQTASAQFEVGGRRFQFLTGSDAAEFYGKARQSLQQRAENDLKSLRKQIADDGLMNPFDRFDRSALDKAAKESGDHSAILQNTDEGWSRGKSYIDQYGVLPKSVAEAAMSHMGSVDVAVKAKSYELLSLAHTKDPLRGLENSGVTGEVKRRVEKYDALRSIDGLSDVAAIARVEREADPTFGEMVKKDATKINKAAARRSFSEVATSFGITEDGWFTSNNFGDESVKRALVDDYQRNFRSHMEEGVSEDTAIAMAKNDLKRTYGYTEVMGKRRFMRFPPELMYPALPQGGHSYIKEQAGEYVNDVLYRSDVGYKVDPENIFLKGNADTGRDARAGRPPRYEVYYKDAKGLFQVIPGTWSANAERAYSEMTTKAIANEIAKPAPKVDVKKARDRAKTKREEPITDVNAFPMP